MCDHVLSCCDGVGQINYFLLLQNQVMLNFYYFRLICCCYFFFFFLLLLQLTICAATPVDPIPEPTLGDALSEAGAITSSPTTTTNTTLNNTTTNDTFVIHNDSPLVACLRVMGCNLTNPMDDVFCYSTCRQNTDPANRINASTIPPEVRSSNFMRASVPKVQVVVLIVFLLLIA